MNDWLSVLRAAVLHTFPQYNPESVSLTPLDGGITNHNALVTVAAESVRMVARLPGDNTELLGISRIHEQEASHRAAELGIGPPVLAELHGVGTLVTEFIDGHHVAEADLPKHLPTIIDLMHRFHSSTETKGTFPIFRVVEAHETDAIRLGVSVPSAASDLRAIAKQIEQVLLSTPDPNVPCHNDLLPGNLLFTSDRCYLLDYEYAGMNNAYFDLANLSVNNGFEASNDEQMLMCYFGEVSDRARARLSLMKVMSEYREAMWAVVQQGISTLDTDFVAYAAERFQRAHERVPTDFAATLQAAR